MTIKNKVNLSIVVFLTFSILTVILIILPLLEKIKSNSHELIFQQEEFAVLEVQIRNLEGFKILYKDLEEILKEINNLFVDSDLPVGFITFLEKTAEDCEIPIEISSSLSAKTEKDIWPSLFFQISSTSSFPKFLKFLEKIEVSQYLIEIQNLNVRGLAGKEVKSKEYEKFSSSDVKTTLLLKVFTK